MGYIRDRWKDPPGRARGRRWQVEYQVDGREKDGGSFDVKEVAKRKLVELEASVHRGQWVDPTDQTTVTELVRAYAATLVLTTYWHLLAGGEELARKAIDGAWNAVPDGAVTAQGGPDDVDTGSGAGQARLPVDAGLFSPNRYVFLATAS